MPTEALAPSMRESSSRVSQTSVPAAMPARPLSDAEQERMHRLGLELRCLVCQNQSISDSNSGLAVDLRNQIAGQIRDGKSDADIKQYMVERYGDFVLYKPPFSAGNAALWIGPFVLLLIGVILAIRSIRRRKLAAPEGDAALAGNAPESLRLREIEERYRRDSGQ
ncbi:MAG: cytochrome c-type biogenesis protein [Burkholderiaceae bacterium]